jgi:hypothetical protein
MYLAILRKEFKLFLGLCKLTFAIHFVIYGVFVGGLLMSSKGIELMPIPKEMDLFTLFCTFSIAMSSMFLFMSAPTSMVEKSLGLVDNMLAYLGSPRWLFVPKALFLWAVAYTSFLFWSVVGCLASLFTSSRFVDRGFIARDAALALLFYPMLLFFLALVQVFFIYVFPHLAQLVNVLLFALMFLIFSYVAQIASKVMTANVLMVAFAFLLLGGVNALLVALMGRLPSEAVVKSR